MKRIMFLLCFTAAFTGASFAQTSIEFIPTAGYTFADKVDFNSSYGRISDGLNLSGSFRFNFNRHFAIELMYDHMDASAKMYDYSNNYLQAPFYQTHAGINYIMIGPVTSFQVPTSPVHIFLGPLLGASIFTPGPDDFSSNVKFAWGLQAGTDIYINPRLGVRVSARLLSATQSGNDYYFGSFGDHTGSNNYFYSADIYQFGFNAGLIIGLGNVLPTGIPRGHMQRRPPRRYYYY